jgi:hypothetical protein
MLAIITNMENIMLKPGQESKNTAVLEARVPHTTLATCAKWLIDDGRVVRSRSDLIRQIMDTIAATIERDGGFVFKDIEEAVGYLYSLGIGSCNRIGANGRPMNTFSLNKGVYQQGLTQVQSDEDIFAEVAKGVEMFKSNQRTGTYINVEEPIDISRIPIQRPDTSLENIPEKSEDGFVNLREATAVQQERDKVQKEKDAAFIASMTKTKQEEV